MLYPTSTLLKIAASLILSGVLILLGNPSAHAGGEAIEDRVAGILFEESVPGKIKVVVSDFSVSSGDDGERKLSDKELKDRGTQYTEEFTANLMNKIKAAGKRERISIIDRSRLDDILREKNLPATDIPEHTIEIGRTAGVDVIITGRIQATGKSVTATAKVIRVKDGEILDIVKQDKQKIASPIVHTRVTILETVEKLEIGSSKILPLKLTTEGTLSVAIEVVHGNPIDINVIPAGELENLKGHKEFNNVADFTATTMKSYARSAHLDTGDYFLVLRDSSLGIFSVQSGKVKIVVQLEP